MQINPALLHVLGILFSELIMLFCLLEDISTPQKVYSVFVCLHLLLQGCIHFFILAFTFASDNPVVH